MTPLKQIDPISAAEVSIKSRLRAYENRLTRGAVLDERNQFTQYFHNFNEYRLFVPSRYDGTPLPLVVMLHGCNQTATKFAHFTGMNELAEDKNFIVAYPEQSTLGNFTSTWHWFKPEHQVRGSGEPALIVGIVADIKSRYAVLSDKVFVAGFSSGAALAVIMGVTYPDVFSGVGAHSGLPYATAQNLADALCAMYYGAPNPSPEQKAADLARPLTPTIVFQGDADATVHSRNAHQIIDRARGRRNYTDRITRRVVTERGRATGYTRYTSSCDREAVRFEHWDLHNFGHDWSGNKSTEPDVELCTPDASREMIRFFFAQTTQSAA
jgi:poly(hydroxyalkanoate) depolymerase family esterase